MTHATVIPPTGTVRGLDFEPEDTLDALQAAVGCYIEVAGSFTQDGQTVYVIVDEEGLLKPNPEGNGVASGLVGRPVFGTAVLISEEDFQ